MEISSNLLWDRREWYVGVEKELLLPWLLFYNHNKVDLFVSIKDKILETGGRHDSIQVTNDGATILKSIGVDNPAGKILVGKNDQ